MSKARSSEPRHVRLYHWLTECPAYRSLDAHARALLVEFKMRYTGSNNGDIGLSGKEMEEALGCSNRPADRACRTLIDRGFIRLSRKGSFDWKHRSESKPRSNTWTLTEYPLDYPRHSAMPATKDFMKWRPAENKTRGAVGTAMRVRAHRIEKPMRVQAHLNGVTTAPHLAQNDDIDAGTIAPTYNIPHQGGAPNAASPADTDFTDDDIPAFLKKTREGSDR